MKRTFHFLAAAALTLATAACQKEQETNLGENTVTVNFSTSEIQTKTVFGEKTDNKYPTLWTEENAVAISYNLKANSPKKAQVTPSDDKKTASFSIEIEKDETAESHNFYAVSPYSAVTSIYPSYKDFKIEIPSSQTPGDLTCDEAAQIITAKSESSTFESDITLSFSHITAYGNMSIDLTGIDAGTVKTISLTASKEIAGTYFYYPESDKLQANSASKTITLNTDKVSDIFFACAPADLSGGSLDITVTAENGTYEKSINLTGKTLKFEAGKISKFSVKDFTKKDTDEVYTLVTDASSLKIGDKIIIAAAGSNFAISTIQNANNRGQAVITKSENSIVNPGANVQLFTLEDGTVTGTYAFNTGSGYIYDAGTSKNNYIKTEDKIDANASWSINCTESGIATITANGTNKKKIRYNKTASVFSCYASGQEDIAIYTDGKGIFTPKLSLTPEDATIDCNVTETSFNIVSNISWTISSDVDWAMAMTDKGPGNAEIQITLDQNTSTTSRTAKFTVESEDKTITKVFTLTQNAFEPKLEFDTDNATVLANATSAKFNVTSNTDWTVSSDADWIVFKEEGSMNSAVEILFDANTGAERTAILTITTKDGSVSKTFTLTQKAAGEKEAKTAIYTVASTTSVTASGDIPEGSKATFKNTYSNSKDQITSGKGQTYTLSGYNGKIIKKVILSMHSNTSKGAGTFSLKAGDTTLASISSATTFNKWFDNTAFSTTYKDVTVTLTEDNYEIKEGENIVLVISATANSLYCQSITIIYQ